MDIKNEIDLETYKIVREAMSSNMSKDEFRRFLEQKKEELKGTRSRIS